jgi:nucleoside-diphosphate-sugar epimerase
MGHNLGIMTHKILLLGANGQVGHALQTTLKPLGEVVCCTRAELDLSTLSTQPTALAELVQQVKPTIIVNASAYTAVDRAEAEPELAMLLNAQVPGWLGAAAQAVLAWCITQLTTCLMAKKPAPIQKRTRPIRCRSMVEASLMVSAYFLKIASAVSFYAPAGWWAQSVETS